MMTDVKIIFLIINIFLSFFLLNSESGLAFVTMTASLFIMLDLYFISDSPPPSN